MGHFIPMCFTEFLAFDGSFSFLELQLMEGIGDVRRGLALFPHSLFSFPFSLYSFPSTPFPRSPQCLIGRVVPEGRPTEFSENCSYLSPGRGTQVGAIFFARISVFEIVRKFHNYIFFSFNKIRVNLYELKFVNVLVLCCKTITKIRVKLIIINIYLIYS